MNNTISAEEAALTKPMNMDTLTIAKDHLEVTGVSRSGRVCKKSSKLMDFQAADEMEPKPKRSTPAKKQTPKLPNSTTKSPKKNGRSILDSPKSKTSKTTSKSDHHRPTAYTLWAKDYRAMMKATQPHVKTSSYAHRLATLWAEVPNSEKYSWRRRARRAVDQTQELHKLNEKLTASKLAANKTVNNGTITNGLPTIKKVQSTNPYENVKFSTLSLDAAAHLQLLGENLNQIGERLKEHEGQINVSGTLSVLLDSILCSMGPLMVLTKAIPTVRNDAELNRNLSNTIDNISYIMPGL